MWEGEDAHREFDARCEEDAVAVAKACGHDVLRLGYWRLDGGQTDREDRRLHVSLRRSGGGLLYS